MKKFIVLLYVLLLFTQSKVCSQTFATVDTRILLILHPSMNSFDYNNQAFYRDQNPEKISNEMLKKLSEAQEKAEKENVIINKEIEKLDKECRKIAIELIREKETFAPGDITEFRKQREALKSSLDEQKKKVVDKQDQVKTQQNKIKTIENKIKELDDVLNNRVNRVPNEENIKKYNEILNRLYNKIADLELKKLDNLDKSMSVLYLTQDETKKRLEEISKEIKSIISEIAKKEGCDIVIDNTFAIRDPNRKEKRVIISGNEFPDVVSGSLFHSLTSFNSDEENIKATGMPKEQAIQHILLGRSVQTENNLKRYLEYKDYVPARVADFSFGTLFVTGGKDITSLCAQKLFDKYNIPEYTKQRYMPILVEYMNKK